MLIVLRSGDTSPFQLSSSSPIVRSTVERSSAERRESNHGEPPRDRQRENRTTAKRFAAERARSAERDSDFDTARCHSFASFADILKNASWIFCGVTRA